MKSKLWLVRFGWVAGLVLGMEGFAASVAEAVIDPAVAVKRGTNAALWYDAGLLGVEGRGWADTKAFYDRLPARAEVKVRAPVWNLSRHSAGMCVRFVTDASTIRARWVLANSWIYLQNMAATGVSGLDLYVRTDEGQWRWLGLGIPSGQTNEAKLAENLPPGKREYLLYLPLHNGVQSLELGLEPGCALAKAGPWGPGQRKPIVFYGTSIQQGLCASRPGMVHSAILGRRLNWPSINLGFSGQGKMEPEMAELLAELDPAIYVLDCLPNLGAAEVKERTEPFVRILRRAHPATPIVLVEDRSMGDAWLVAGRAGHHQSCRTELKAAFDRLKQDGVPALYYIPGQYLVGDDGEGLVDGSHPSDLGFMRQADVFQKTLEPLTLGALK